MAHIPRLWGSWNHSFSPWKSNRINGVLQWVSEFLHAPGALGFIYSVKVFYMLMVSFFLLLLLLLLFWPISINVLMLSVICTAVGYLSCIVLSLGIDTHTKTNSHQWFIEIVINDWILKIIMNGASAITCTRHIVIHTHSTDILIGWNLLNEFVLYLDALFLTLLHQILASVGIREKLFIPH